MKRKFAIVGLIVALFAAVSLAGGWAAPFTLGSMNIATAAAAVHPHDLGGFCTTDCDVLNSQGYIKWNSSDGHYREGNPAFTWFNIIFGTNSDGSEYAELQETANPSDCVGFVYNSSDPTYNTERAACGTERTKWNVQHCSNGDGSKLFNQLAMQESYPPVLNSVAIGDDLITVTSAGACVGSDGWSS